MTNSTINKTILSATTAMFLTACGGGGGTTEDKTKPIISLIGANVSLTVGGTYTDEGATATDDVDGNITSNITHTGNVVVGTEGTYTITYNVSDAAGNAADPVTRTVTVNPVPVEVAVLANATAQTYTKDTAITALVFANTGGAVASCTVAPTLPAGLAVAVKNNTCEITGTPTAVTAEDTYTVTGTNATNSATATVKITVNDIPNEAPTANAGTDVTVNIGTTITLIGLGEDDGEIASYSWAEAGREIATTASFEYTPITEGTKTLTLTVKDDDNVTATDEVIITVQNPIVQRTFTVSDDNATIDDGAGLTWQHKLIGKDTTCDEGYRLPSVEEIVTIVDHEKNDPGVQDAFKDLFTSGIEQDLPLRTTDANRTLRSQNGTLTTYDKQKILCVKGTFKADEHNVTRDDSNETNIDNVSNLEWYDKTKLGHPSTFTDAEAVCKNLDGDDWILPTMQQINGIYNIETKTLEKEFLSNTPTKYIWTQTQMEAHGKTYTWLLNFTDGLTRVVDTNNTLLFDVSCVREAN